MQVTLADPIIQVTGWTKDLDKIGEFTLRVRKTPAEMREERKELRNMYGDGARQPSQIREVCQTCITKDPNNPSVAMFLPGLWPRVKRALDKKGVEYTIVDRRDPDIRPPLDMSAFEGVQFRETQDTAVALIASMDCGIIECSTGYGKSFLIALMCKAYPTLNIVVTTTSTQVIDTLYEYLCKTIPGQVGVLHAGKNTVAGKRVICTTLKSLPNIPADKVQLLFVDECHCVGSGTMAQDLMRFCFARRFGFSASPIRNDGSQLMMESILGPVILKMSYEEAVDAEMVTPMKYYMLPCHSCPKVATRDNLPDVMLKRYSYWDNYARNNAIRNLVYKIKNNYKGQILIMVGTLEHAINLNRLLPWFKVAYYGNMNMADLQAKFPESKYPGINLSQYKLNSKQVAMMRGAFAKGTLKYVISTKIFKQGVNLSHLACLIRADGDTSGIECIQIPGRLSRLDKGKEWAYLIDIFDTFSQWAIRRTKSRDAQYQAQKWQQITEEELINGLREQSADDVEEPSGGDDSVGFSDVGQAAPEASES